MEYQSAVMSIRRILSEIIDNGNPLFTHYQIDQIIDSIHRNTDIEVRLASLERELELLMRRHAGFSN